MKIAQRNLWNEQAILSFSLNPAAGLTILKAGSSSKHQHKHLIFFSQED